MSGSRDRISHILKLVNPAVLLPWPSGSKGDDRKWKHVRLTDMDEATYLAKLEKAGNIGVALGRVSEGLVTIDLDQDSFVDSFLEANPLLANTLRTRGSRGCNIWVRCSCDYPGSQNLKNEVGIKIGEWRADGNQTIVSGTHPDGMSYHFIVEHPAITITYNAIIWPKCILAPYTPSCATESKRVIGVREYKVVGVGGCDSGSSILELKGDLISQVAPKAFRQNNASLFKLARLVRSYENAVDRLATTQELQDVFDRWCLVARPFWRHPRDDYWAEFLQAYHYARIGLDQDPLEVALSRASASPLPEVPGFSDERVRLLAGLCREMQRLVGNNSFFLPARKLGQLLSVHWSSVARWLVALEALGVIRLAPGEVRKRGGIRSPRYYYSPPLHQSLQAIHAPKLLATRINRDSDW